MDTRVFDDLIFPVENIEEIGDLIMDGQESSRLSLGLEPLHDPLPSSPRLDTPPGCSSLRAEGVRTSTPYRGALLSGDN
jgi:hypothetical protein